MAHTKTIRIRYFRAEFENEENTGCEVHEVLRARMTDAPSQRYIGVGSDLVGLASYERIADCDGLTVWAGDMRRFRMEDRVAEGAPDADLHDIELPEGHAIVEMSLLVVVPAYRTVLYYFSQEGASWGQFRNYLQRFAVRDAALEFLPVVDQEQRREFDRMESPRTVVLKIARPDSPNVDDDPPVRVTTAQAGRRSESFGEKHVTVRWGMGHCRRGLDLRLKDVLKRMLRWEEEQPGRVVKATVEGYLNEDGTDRRFIDLLKTKLEDVRLCDMAAVPDSEQFRRSVLALMEESLYDNLRHLRRQFQTT